MGQVQPVISSTTQSLRLEQVTTRNASTFILEWRFQSPPPGMTWTGTIIVPDAQATAVFECVIGGRSWGTFTGPSTFGPVQIEATEQMVVTCIEDPNPNDTTTTIPIYFTGSSDTYLNVQPIYPDPSPSFVNTRNTNVVEALPNDVAQYQVWDVVANDPATVFSTSTLPKVYDAVGVSLVPTVGKVPTNLQEQWQVTMTVNGVAYQQVSPFTAWGYSYGPTGLVNQGTDAFNFLFNVIVSPGDTVTVTVSMLQPYSTQQLRVSVVGYISSPVMAIQNAPNVALGVVPYGGSLKWQSVGGTIAPQNGPTNSPVAGSSNLVFRLHSISYTGLGTNTLTLYGLSNALPTTQFFQVQGGTNAQPQFVSFHGLTLDAPTLSYSTSVALSAFRLYWMYDLVPAPPVWIGQSV